MELPNEEMGVGEGALEKVDIFLLTHPDPNPSEVLSGPSLRLRLLCQRRGTRRTAFSVQCDARAG